MNQKKARHQGGGGHRAVLSIDPAIQSGAPPKGYTYLYLEGLAPVVELS